ncbi:unnamed protein product, partial [Rotaria sp. Silwood1]
YNVLKKFNNLPIYIQ